jgi:cytochrome c5
MKAIFLALAMAAVPMMVKAQGLPDGPGKALVENQCASCHGLEQVVAHRDTKDGWSTVVDYMVSRGMAATDEEVKTMVEYFAKNFPPVPKPDAGKGKSK